MANAPLVEAGRRGLVEMICPTGAVKYFFKRDWTVDSGLIGLAIFDFWRKTFPAISGRRRDKIAELFCAEGAGPDDAATGIKWNGQITPLLGAKSGGNRLFYIPLFRYKRRT